MGVYNRQEKGYDLTRQFRVNNGTVWNKASSIIFWLRANSETNTLTDNGPRQVPVAPSGSGNLSASSSPDVRFPFASINFENNILFFKVHKDKNK